MVGIQAEVRAPVLIVDPGRRVHHARPEPEVVRFDQADGVPVGVHGAQEDGPPAGWVGRRWGRSGASGVDQRRQAGQSRRVQQPVNGDVPEGRVGQRSVTVGHGQLGGLQAGMDPARIGDAVRPERGGRGRGQIREDAEEFEGHDAGAVGRMGRDPDASIVDGDRRPPGRRVLAEIARDDRSPDGSQSRRLDVGEVAVVERIEAVPDEDLEGRRERRQPDALAAAPGSSVRTIESMEPGIGREDVAEHGAGRLDRLDELVPGREAAPPKLDRRRENGRPRQAPVAPVGIRPRTHRSGHGDRLGSSPRRRRQAAGAQGRCVGGGRCPAGSIEGDLLAAVRVPDEPEGVAADPATLGHHHAKDRIRRDRGVHCRSTVAEHLRSSGTGEVMRRHDAATAAPREQGHALDRPSAPASTPASSRRSWASGSSATPSRIAVATSMPSIPRASAANPPMTAPMIWPMARKTE